MNANLAKIFGWAQFGLTTVSQVLSTGVPHNAQGWVGMLGSLLMAVGIHAAGSTDGAK